MATAIIPARAGSVGLPRKAIAKVYGDLSLLEVTIGVAIDAGLDTFVTTDSKEFADVAADAGAFVIKRPKELALGHIHSVHPTLHAIDHLELPGDEIVFMLLPTCPLRRVDDIIEAERLLKTANDPEASVVGVSQVSRINSLRKVYGLSLTPLDPDSQKHASRQEADPVFKVNGMIFCRRAASLRKHKTFHSFVVHQFIHYGRAIDIDCYEDLDLARILYPHRDMMP